MVQGGVPLWPNPQAGVLYPPAWLLQADFQAALPIYLFFHWFLGSVGAWAWVRTRCGDGWPPLLAGVSYGACGATFSLALTPDKLPGQAAAPWVLLGITWLLSDGRGSRRAAGLALLSLGVAASWLGGSVEGVVWTAASGLVWAALLPGARPSGGPAAIRRTAGAAAALVLGTALAAPVLLPLGLLLPHTDRAEGLSAPAAGDRAFAPRDLVAALVPNAYWGGEDLSYRTEPGGATRKRWLRSPYMGIPLLAMAGLALWPRRRRDGRAATAAWDAAGPAPVAGGMAAGLLLGVFVLLSLGPSGGLWTLFRLLPGAGAIRYPEKAWMATAAPLAWLAAAGIRRLQGSRRGAALGMLATLGVALDLGFAAWGSLPVADEVADRGTPAVAAAILADRAGSAVRGGAPPRLWDDSLHRRNGLPRAEPGEELRELQRELLVPNVAVRHGIAYVDGTRELRMARQALLSGPVEDLPARQRRAVLRRMGADYWLVWDPAEALELAVEAGLRPVPAAPGRPLGLGLLAEPEPLPRARIARQAIVVADAEAARDEMPRAADDVVVLVRGDPLVDELAAAVSPGAAAAADLPGEPGALFAARRDGPGDWRVRVAGPGVLVLQESWAPGWRYSLDGGPERPAARADVMFVGVPVPAGEGDAEIRVRYRPAGRGAGLVVAGAALLLLVLMARRLAVPA
jgi:hypothetical protein